MASYCLDQLAGKYFIIKHKYIPFNTACRLFDALVVPVLLYGCEIWGYEKQENIERVQMAFCKFFLGVSKGANNMAILGECGRVPLYVTYHTRCIKYWIEIQEMPSHRYPKQVYTMLEHQHNLGRTTWATHIRRLLIQYDLEHVWETRQLGNRKKLLAQLQQNIENKFKNTWKEIITTQDQLCIYKDFKIEFHTEAYVSELQDFRLRSALARLRSSSHNLKIEAERGQRHVTERQCDICKQIEDEYHFIAKCTKYRELRRKYLDTEQITNYEEYIRLMSATDIDTVKKLAWFIFLANKENNHQ